MFWTNNYVSSPYIDALLNKEDIALHELMDEDDILQECKSQNKKLIEYLTRPEVMEELVTLTTKEPSLELEERWRYKYPNVACELLTCDVPALNEKLAGDEMLLSKLYSFIDTDQPLNPLLASFFSKIIGVLVTRKSDQVLEFLRSRQGCVDLLLQHLETSAIMDLVLKLITQVEGSDMRQHILYWLDGQQLVQRLVKLLSPTSEEERHANAAQLLCDMVRAERENRITSTDPDPILNTLESAETVNLLLQTILTEEKSESSIVGGIEVLLALLGQKTNTILNEGDIHGNDTTEDMPDNNEQSIKISIAVLPYLEHLHKLLLEPPYKPAIKTTVGLLECPLGNTRLQVAKLFTALLSTENTKIREKMADLGTFQILLDLFFKYSWNNFLHTQAERCLALAIKTDSQDTNNIIYADIFIKCKLIDRILEAWDKNENKQTKEKGVRQGYMGHLINMANDVVTQCEQNSSLESFLKENLSAECFNEWEAFVINQLDEINKAHQICLGGQPQAYMNNLDDYNSYSNGPYAQQAYANYQEQQMTPPFIENYGLHDDEFNDADDVRHNSVDQLTTAAFTFTEENLDKGEDMFNKMCQQKQRTGAEENNSGGEWGDEGELTFQTVIDKRNWSSKQQHHDSSNSDNDDDPTDVHMEIDSSDPWDSSEPTSNSVILPKVNPWDVAPSQPVEQTGWANFDQFETTLNIEAVPEVNNKPCNDIKEETSKVPVSIIEKDKLFENKVDEEAVGSGDAEKIEATEVTCSVQFKEININSKIVNAVNSDSVHTTADNNANPSEIAGNRKLETSEKSESIKSLMESENASSNDNVKHVLANLSTTSLATTKESK